MIKLPSFSLPDPIATGTMTRRDVLLFLRYVARLDLRLPQVKLLPGERMKLAGHLFPGATYIALQVAYALRWAPRGLFDEYAVAPDELEGRVLRGANLRALAHGLRIIARRVDDMALLDDSSATQDAMRILRAAIPIPLVPGSFLDRRRLYLGPALLSWGQYLRRFQQRKAPAKPPASVQRKATRAADRAQAARLAQQLFNPKNPMPAAVDPKKA